MYGLGAMLDIATRIDSNSSIDEQKSLLLVFVVPATPQSYLGML